MALHQPLLQGIWDVSQAKSLVIKTFKISFSEALLWSSLPIVLSIASVHQSLYGQGNWVQVEASTKNRCCCCGFSLASLMVTMTFSALHNDRSQN